MARLATLIALLLGLSAESGIASSCDGYVDTIVAYNPGEGTGEGWNDPNTALGPPQGCPTFPCDYDIAVSLGHYGSVVIAFSAEFVEDRPGDDIVIHEVGSLERALVEVSLDGQNYVELGEAYGTTSFDFASRNVFGARFVRIVDLASIGLTPPHTGFDVDAVEALNFDCAVPVTQTSWGAVKATYR